MKTSLFKLQRYYLLGVILFLCTIVSAQDLPSIVPPSPNAAALHTYGNTQVNYYTGSANITIPLWEVKEGDLTVPIYLKYTGGNGIKVEDVASWVGLGWTLNTGGAISRTIRGTADDEPSKGLFNTTIPIPDSPPNNFQAFEDIGDGDRDSQSDMYMYNYLGGSGSFFFDTDENIYYKPKSNIDLSYNIGTYNDNISATNCTTGHSIIKDFTLKDPYGNSYLFDEKEISNTITFNAGYTDNRGFPSTWYLKKIENRLKTRSIDYEYDGYSYTLKRSGANIPVGGYYEDDVYTETSYIGRRIKKITYSQGSVEFIASTAYRKDLTNNKYLDKIIVKDSNGDVIKTIKFNYKYMTDDALENVTTTITNPKEEIRLILMSVEECDGSDNCLNPTTLNYDTSEYLPSRFSKAQDHWGYYNGESSNAKYEPEQVIKWWHIGVGWDYDEVGSANRNPHDTYSRAGILTEIEYPTGGTTKFEYESHTAVNDDIDGVFTNPYVILQWAKVKSYFTIDWPSNHYPTTSTLKVTGFSGDASFIPVIKVKNLTTNVTTSLNLPPGSQGGSTTYPNEVLLDADDYEVSFGGTQVDPAWIKVSWENIDTSPNKIIGGLRLKTISDYYDTNELATKKDYDYTGDDSNTSGRVINVPKYYGLTFSPNLSDTIPSGYQRYINPFVPLATTQGSDVGYGKVTIIDYSEVNGKEEQYYSTVDDYLDNDNRIDPVTGSLLQRVWDGVKIEKYPLPEKDSKDFMRGILKKQILYKKSGSAFSKVYEKELLNNSLVYSNVLPLSYAYVKPEVETTLQLKVNNLYDANGLRAGEDFTYYEIHTGYNVPSKTVETFYNDSGNIVKTTTQKYDEIANGIIEYYAPTSVEVVDSEGITSKTNTTYVFNEPSRTIAEDSLHGQNALYIPLSSESYKGTELLGKQYTVYNNSSWTGLNMPEKVQAAKGSSSLTDRIIYDEYDSDGNILEVSKKDGTSIVYLYGYDNSLPIAKIENASFSDVPTSIYSGIQTASDNDVSTGTENALRTELAKLRSSSSCPNLTDAMITTFTYDPMVGVTSVTDPRGRTMYYYYDEHSRLEFVKDHNGKILSENEYNYKQ